MGRFIAYNYTLSKVHNPDNEIGIHIRCIPYAVAIDVKCNNNLNEYIQMQKRD